MKLSKLKLKAKAEKNVSDLCGWDKCRKKVNIGKEKLFADIDPEMKTTVYYHPHCWEYQYESMLAKGVKRPELTKEMLPDSPSEEKKEIQEASPEKEQVPEPAKKPPSPEPPKPDEICLNCKHEWNPKADESDIIHCLDDDCPCFEGKKGTAEELEAQ